MSSKNALSISLKKASSDTLLLLAPTPRVRKCHMGYSNDIKIFSTLQKHAVEYLIIGGTAVSFYGEYRMSRLANGQVTQTADYDFWYNPNLGNYYRLLSAVEELGKDVTRYRDETPDPKKDVFKFEFEEENYTIDFLPHIMVPISFREALERRTTVERDGIVAYFIGLEDLINDKQALGRQKDFDDIENLRKHNPNGFPPPQP
ncbi:nucleotidyltransferase [Spirosoma oryzae]|nr:nucleotidyltransferase [Spirosoma oryzae]